MLSDIHITVSILEKLLLAWNNFTIFTRLWCRLEITCHYSTLTANTDNPEASSGDTRFQGAYCVSPACKTLSPANTRILKWQVGPCYQRWLRYYLHTRLGVSYHPKLKPNSSFGSLFPSVKHLIWYLRNLSAVLEPQPLSLKFLNMKNTSTNKKESIGLTRIYFSPHWQTNLIKTPNQLISLTNKTHYLLAYEAKAISPCDYLWE